VRARAVPAPARSRPAPPPKKPLGAAPAAAAEPAEELRKPARPGAPTAPPPNPIAPPATSRAAAPGAAAPDGEDGDPVEPGSLLAGPRNVQPYIAKRGEQYMGKEQLDHFRNILNSWKRDLMVEVDRTVSHMKDEAANFPDPNDRATQEEEFSLELRTRDRERKLIRKIDDALKRIEDGSYGYCLETGEEIGIKRLEARPVATLSIEAQERRERRERQYGDRDDRYR
jgi:DnaK suppressor protein